MNHSRAFVEQIQIRMKWKDHRQPTWWNMEKNLHTYHAQDGHNFGPEATVSLFFYILQDSRIALTRGTESWSNWSSYPLGLTLGLFVKGTEISGTTWRMSELLVVRLNRILLYYIIFLTAFLCASRGLSVYLEAKIKWSIHLCPWSYPRPPALSVKLMENGYIQRLLGMLSKGVLRVLNPPCL